MTNVPRLALVRLKDEALSHNFVKKNIRFLCQEPDPGAWKHSGCKHKHTLSRTPKFTNKQQGRMVSLSGTKWQKVRP
jgi:hypothetical protein